MRALAAPTGSKVNHRLADEYEEVVRKDSAELAALEEIVRRAGEEGLQVRLLLE